MKEITKPEKGLGIKDGLKWITKELGIWIENSKQLVGRLKLWILSLLQVKPKRFPCIRWEFVNDSVCKDTIIDSNEHEFNI